MDEERLQRESVSSMTPFRRFTDELILQSLCADAAVHLQELNEHKIIARFENDILSCDLTLQFLRPARGETVRRWRKFKGLEVFQSTRPARGETCFFWRSVFSTSISIHSPRTGRDAWAYISRAWRCHFNPLAPHRARLGRDEFRAKWINISIHSPRTGRDSCSTARRWASLHFNPLAPHGARLVHDHWQGVMGEFQSTRPARGETQ